MLEAQCTTSTSVTGDFYKAPITIASTISPLNKVLFSSVLGGRISRALADRTLSSRLLIWLPVLSAVGRTSLSWAALQLRTHRWYSGRGSSLMSADNYIHRHTTCGWLILGWPGMVFCLKLKMDRHKERYI